MTYYFNYEFDLIINSTKTDLDPSNYSFIQKDSIHNLFPELYITFYDITGYFQEAQLNSEGMDISLSYGVNGRTSNYCKYNIVDECLQRIYNKDSIAGDIPLNAIHEYYNKQDTISKGYSGRISDVTSTIFSDYVFTSKTINDTGCQNKWYRPLLNQEEFLNQILLPNAYSLNSKDSPFFCFITSNNEFNFRNYSSMLNTENTPKKKFRLSALGLQRQESEYVPIFDLVRVTTGSSITKKLRKRSIFYRNRNTGEYETETDNIENYPKTVNKQLPIIKYDFNTSYIDLLYKETDSGMQEALKGRKISSEKDGMFLERFIINCPLTPEIKAGDMIYCELPLKDLEKNTKLSNYYSDNYLVEKSEHYWNGQQKIGFSKFTISRKFVNISTDYYTKSRYISS